MANPIKPPATPSTEGEKQEAGAPNPPRNKGGRPRVRRVSDNDVARVDPEGMIDKLFQTLAFEVLRIRRDVARRGALSADEAKRVGFIARAVETCAQAKRHLIEAAKAEDLSSIPTDQLVRVVVGQMRKLPEVYAAVAAEINRRKPAEGEATS